jgi:hypothetical protein
MSMTTRIAAVIACTFLTTSCGLLSNNSKIKEKRTETNAEGRLDNGNFSLSLPEIPGVETGKYKAHLRIFQGSIPAAADYCHQNGMPIKMPDVGQPIYEDSIPYKVGSILGPFKLDSGKFTAVLDIYDGGQSPSYSGMAFFPVMPNEIVTVDLVLNRAPVCDGPGGVIINPVMPDENDDLVSACMFDQPVEYACEKAFAGCQWKDYGHKSECGVNDARSGLIRRLCSENVMVSKSSFLNEIECFSEDVVSEPPMPDPEPQAARLHAVGIYEARSDHSFGNHPMGKHVIRVKGTGRVILALASYEPVTWVIEPGEAVVERVIAMGYHKQVIEGSAMKTETHCYEAGCDFKDYAYFYEHPSTESKKFLDKIFGLTNLKADSVQGSYTSTETVISN